MKTKITSIVLFVLSLGTFATADSFESLQTSGRPIPTEGAAGVFLPIHEGAATAGWVFLVQGGLRSELNQEPIADVWLLDERTWLEVSSSAPRVAGHVLVAGADGRAYAFGGHDPDDEGDLRDLNEITAYQVRRIGGNVEVEVEDIFVPGGHPGKCTDAAAVAIDGGRSILHLGGFCNWNVMDNGSREVWEYRIGSNSWTRRADLPHPRLKHSAVFHQGYVWVFAGDGPGGPSNDIFRYDTKSDAWCEIQTSGEGPAPLEDHRAVVVGDSMLVFGGIRSKFWPATTDEVWSLDLRSLEWTRKRDLPTGLARMPGDILPPELTASPYAQVILVGGVIEPWSFPCVLSDDTLVYTSDERFSGGKLAIPAIARIQGRGAFFTSTLTLMNGGEKDLDLELTMTPRIDIGGRPITVRRTVPAGTMEVIENPLVSLFGFGSESGGVGALLVEVVEGTAGDLLMQSFITARLDSGEEYGAFFPAVRSEEALTASEVGYLTTTSKPSTYRVNVGLMALADGTEVTVAPVASIGEPLALPLGVTLDEGENLQINDVHRSFGVGLVPDVMIEVSVEAGLAVAYATVLDGNGSYTGTSDPTVLQPLVVGSEETALLEIGSIQGLDEFSGSATVVNLSSFEADVRALFFERGTPGASSSRTFTVGAGEATGFDDLVGDLFGVFNGVGTVIFESLNGALISASGREFAILRGADGKEIVGTAGTQLPGLSEVDLVTPEKTWHVIGVRQKMDATERERSHLAIFNPGHQNARVTVRLVNGGDASPEGVRSWIVKGRELIQIDNFMKKINGQVDGFEKRIEITVDNAVYLHVFRVNTWGDAMTLPVSEG